MSCFEVDQFGLPKILWPENAKSAALITINFESDRRILSANPEFAGLRKTLSTAKYGLDIGANLVKKTLDSYNLNGVWFFPGLLVPEAKDFIFQLKETGHELAATTWDLVSLAEDNQAQAVDLIQKSLAAFAELGVEPTGFRLSVGEWPLYLSDLLLANGFTWSSSWHQSEIPFWQLSQSSPGLLELPQHWAMNDRQAFVWNFAPAMPAGHSRIASYADVLAAWKMEFMASHAEGGLFQLTLHPEIIGTPGRIALLAELLEFISDTGEVWIPTGTELRDFWSKTYPSNPADHPIEVFKRLHQNYR